MSIGLVYRVRSHVIFSLSASHGLVIARQNADAVRRVCIEVKTILATLADLNQIIVERTAANVDHLGGLFKRELHIGELVRLLVNHLYAVVDLGPGG